MIKAHNISQQKFTVYIGVSFSTFENWLLYDRIPDINTGCDIADALMEECCSQYQKDGPGNMVIYKDESQLKNE